MQDPRPWATHRATEVWVTAFSGLFQKTPHVQTALGETPHVQTARDASSPRGRKRGKKFWEEPGGDHPGRQSLCRPGSV